MAGCVSLLPFLLVSALLALEELISAPSCRISGEVETVAGPINSESQDLRVMVVADLLLLGSDAPYIDTFFRDPFMAKVFSKSFRKLKPDLLLVLGDLSGEGSKLTEAEWLTVLQQFLKILGPTFDLPLHILLGDRDIGQCESLNKKFIRQIANQLPGLDSSGCSEFDIGNVSFVSLNSVSMLCGNNDLRFSVEKVVERESVEFQRKASKAEESTNYGENREVFINFPWKENEMRLGSGPVVLLHFPLHSSIKSHSKGHKVSNGISGSAYSREVNTRSYDLEQTLPVNATEYILQSLKPRIVFSAHSHSFSDHIHADGTREIIVPSLTWASKGKLGFVFVTFGRSNAVKVSHCLVIRELHVITGYLLIFLFSLATILLIRWSKLLR